MSNWMYTIYFIIIAALAIITGEIVAFIMLGLILLTLTNIHRTLREINTKLDK